MAVDSDRVEETVLSALLVMYSWPGNVRELRNVIERAMIMTRGSLLKIEAPTVDAVEAVPPRAGQRGHGRLRPC